MTLQDLINKVVEKDKHPERLDYEIKLHAVGFGSIYFLKIKDVKISDLNETVDIEFN